MLNLSINDFSVSKCCFNFSNSYHVALWQLKIRIKWIHIYTYRINNDIGFSKKLPSLCRYETSHVRQWCEKLWIVVMSIAMNEVFLFLVSLCLSIKFSSEHIHVYNICKHNHNAVFFFFWLSLSILHIATEQTVSKSDIYLPTLRLLYFYVYMCSIY